MGGIEWQVFSYIVAQVETPLISAVTQVVNALLAYAATPLKVCLVLYVALTGVLVLKGYSDETAATILGRFLKMGLVVWVLTGSGVYQHYIHDVFFTLLPTGLTHALTASGATGSVSASSFDQVWIKAWRAGLEVWRTLGWSDITEKLVIVVFWASAIVSTGVAFAIWLISRLFLALSIAVGPLLVGLVLFPATRAIFERWIGFLIACVLLQVLTVVLLFIVLAVENQVVGTVAAMGSVDPMAMLQVLLAGVIFFAVAGFVAFQLPAMASALAGGLHFHTGILARGARQVIGSTGRTFVNADGSRERHGRAGVLGAGQLAGSVAARGVAQAGRALPRLRTPPGGSLSDGG